MTTTTTTIDPGTKVIYNGLTMTLLEHDDTTAVCQWRHKGKLKADLFRLKDLTQPEAWKKS